MFSIYHNFIYGQIAFSISDTDTTIESTGLVGIKTLEPDEYSPVVLDPLSSNGPPEVVYVTEHTEGQATAVVERGKEGTNARSHDFGTQFVHNLTAESLNTLTRIELGTEGVVPVLSETDRDNISDPEDGNVIYNTDTQRLETYDGSEWRQYVASNDVDPQGTAESEASSAVTSHEQESDPHDQYLQSAGDEMTGDLALHSLRERRSSTSSSSPTVNFEGAGLQVLTNSGSTSVSWANVPSASDQVRSVTLQFTNSSSVSWPGGTRFAEGEPPDIEDETWIVAVAADGDVTVFASGAEVST